MDSSIEAYTKFKSIKITGEEDTRTEITSKIDGFVNSLQELSQIKISVKNKNLQEYFRFLLSEKTKNINYEEKLDDLEAEYDIYQDFNLIEKQFTVFGEECEEFHELKDEIIQNFKDLFEDEDPNVQKRCFLCNHEIEKELILHRCNHSFCKECIKLYCYKSFYDTSYLPLTCPISACRCKIVVSDILRIIDSTRHLKKLLRIALEKYIQNNNQCYIKCLTPNCSQVFVAKINSVTCDNCLGKFCLKCKSIFHEGMTCKQANKNAINQNDKSYQEYTINSYFKKCPNQKCDHFIEKTSSSMIKCKCELYICFVCRKEFSKSQECKEHIQSEHEGDKDRNREEDFINYSLF